MTPILSIPLQLAKEVPLAKVKFPAYLEPKYDGVRLAIVKHGDVLVIRTRNGKQAHLPRIEANLKQIEWTGVIECEVTLTTGKMEDRTTVSGMINSSLHGNPINEDALHFYCFDYLSFDDFISKTCKKTYAMRRQDLVGCAVLNNPQFSIATTQVVQNTEEAQNTYEHLISQGYEGAMLKHADSTYDFKRSASWVKMKETKTADLVCTSYLLGTGKYEGMIGSLVCKGIVDGVPVEVAVGSGLTDYDRQQSFATYKGKTIEVKYNALIQDKLGGVHSLFLPRFSCVRFDK
jgi:ATP-dependent DNA ligase